ncbi:MAG: prolyl oligopeptidase family serine peptidase [Planctomycetaceae bacterium]
MGSRRIAATVVVGLAMLVPAAALWGDVPAESAARPMTAVEVAVKPGRPFESRPTTVLADLPAIPRDSSLDRFGGLTTRTAAATGFFRVERVDGRWWLVDPAGGLFLSRGVNSITTVRTAGGREALERRFGTEATWAEETTRLVRAAGFNTAGAWSTHDPLGKAPEPLVQPRLWGFMAAYGKQRGGTFMQAGHVGYPGDCPFIFDPEFPAFCTEHARKVAAVRDDPLVLGHFSDNEMPWSRAMLDNYLRLPADDPGHAAAQAWLAARGRAPAAITDDDRAGFLEHALDRYLSIVAVAIRAADPNHLFLGVRLHEPVFDLPEVFRAAGRHCDVLAVNYYRAWTPDAVQMAMWAGESGRPFMVTEFYAKGVDSGLGNTSGAGWLVKTQNDRGLFYQNFVIGLLRSRHCVGWHWHRYADNDPADTSVDPSNRDSNKGIVSARYEPWAPLLAGMTALNDRIYGLVAMIDGPPTAPPPVAAAPTKKPRDVVFPDDVRVERDVAYLGPDRKQKADLYFPLEMPTGRRVPAVIIIHGGGFNDGDKDRRREVMIGGHLARRGYVGMSIDYLLWSKGIKNPTWPRNLQDAKTAVRWLRANADRLGIDPERIGVIGGSAGGNLAAMLAVTGPKDGLEPPGDDDTSTRVRCAVDLYGVADLMNYHDMKMFLKTREEDPEGYRRASPIGYCDAGDAPVLLIHGTGDEVVDVSQSRTFAAALAAGGVDHDLIEIPDAPHTFDLDYEPFDVKAAVFRFLDRHLKDAGNHP